MSDDIVTRLREEANRLRADAVDIPRAFENCADEIERLRIDRDAWRKTAIEIASWEVQENPEAWATQFYNDIVSGQYE